MKISLQKMKPLESETFSGFNLTDDFAGCLYIKKHGAIITWKQQIKKRMTD